MLDYPSISYDYSPVLGRVCLIQEKLDGHNVRVELNKGSFKLGSRRRLIDSESDDFVFATGSRLFFDKYAEPLARALTDARLRRAAVFAELYGSSTHMTRVDYGVDMDWSFFDILDVSRKRFIEPVDVMKILEAVVPVPTYSIESVDRDTINAVRADETQNREGVVFKPKRVRRPSASLPYAKAKTAWFMGLFNDP